MVTYSVHRVLNREELDAVIEVAWRAWWDPYLPMERLLYPILGYKAEDRANAIANSKERYWKDNQRQTGDRFWIYVRCSDGEIVGGLQLDFTSESPFPNGCPRVDTYWFPDGEEIKEFCQEMLQQAYTPRSIWMHRPHGGLSNMVVHPNHRGRGVGSMLVQYHTRELDRRGIEGFVEASDVGKSLYERHGYQAVMKIASFIPAGKNEDWKRWHHEMGWQFTAMWRPKLGKVEPGARTKPWQSGPSLPIE